MYDCNFLRRIQVCQYVRYGEGYAVAGNFPDKVPGDADAFPDAVQHASDGSYAEGSRADEGGCEGAFIEAV